MRLFALAAIPAIVLGVVGPVSAQTPPDTPTITEPEFAGLVVNPADVHMECAPFSDPDPGASHACSDWQIVRVMDAQLAWETVCIGGLEAVHTHLGDGVFLNDLLGRTELDFSEQYTLRIRHQDNDGLWSDWAERNFVTGPPSEIYPLEITDVLASPPVRLEDNDGLEIILPVGAPAAFVSLTTPDDSLLVRVMGDDGLSNVIEDTPEQEAHTPIRLVVDGGSTGLVLPEFEFVFYDAQGDEARVYLPSMNLGGGAQRLFWVSENGSSFEADGSPNTPDFSVLVRSAPVPWTLSDPAYRVDVVAKDFQLPVNIIFVPEPGEDPDDPFFYVTELYGTIKVVTRDYTVSDYATGLLNFNPTGNFPGSGEQGVGGLAVDPLTGDLFVGLLYDSDPPGGDHFPKVIRMTSADGGLTMSSSSTILDMPGEEQGQSHFISNITIGPDDKLYVHMGDGFDALTALDLDSFRGKILRFEKSGAACVDNPFYDDSDGINARDYVFAYGLRNPFGGAWRPSDGMHYEVENGPGSNDRFAQVVAGQSYGWDGDSSTMTLNALYTWNPPHAPVNISFIDPSIFGGSGFPDEMMDRAFVTESGPTYATGPQSRGKIIAYFELDALGNMVGNRKVLLSYNGAGKASVSGLAPGPDGLDFSDLYRDTGYLTPIDRGAQVLRVRYVGRVDFVASKRGGDPPLDVQFVDQSDVPGAVAWHWEFGDGGTSELQSPTHTYLADGLYDVRLEVTGDSGLVVGQKGAFVIVGSAAQGLRGEYFDDQNLSQLVLSRIDPTIDFQWGSGSPDLSIDENTFSVRWSGDIEVLSSEIHTFTARVDDGVRLWIGGQLIIDQWINQSPTEHSADLELVAGQSYELVMEFYENGGGAVAELYWETPTLAREIVPAAQLVPVQEMVTGAPPPLVFADVLQANYPNPFNPSTSIAFSLARRSSVSLEIYDLRGRHLRSLVSGTALEPGRHVQTWNGEDRRGHEVASGVYLYRLRVKPVDGGPSFEAARRMLLLK